MTNERPRPHAQVGTAGALEKEHLGSGRGPWWHRADQVQKAFIANSVSYQGHWIRQMKADFAGRRLRMAVGANH